MTMTADERTVYDWLAANGVDEWVPEDFWAHTEAGKLTYLAFVWEGPRGWDGGNIKPNCDPRTGTPQVYTEERTVSLLVPPDEQVRAAFTATGRPLTEVS